MRPAVVPDISAFFSPRLSLHYRQLPGRADPIYYSFPRVPANRSRIRCYEFARQIELAGINGITNFYFHPRDRFFRRAFFSPRPFVFPPVGQG